MMQSIVPLGAQLEYLEAAGEALRLTDQARVMYALAGSQKSLPERNSHHD